MLAIATEPVDLIKSMKTDAGATYPMLSDEDHAVSDRYGVYNLLGDGLATPTVIVIDRGGVISWKYVGTDYADRPKTETVLAEFKKAAAASGKVSGAGKAAGS